jgi:hypothetical protein
MSTGAEEANTEKRRHTATLEAAMGAPRIAHRLHGDDHASGTVTSMVRFQIS